MVFGPSPWLKFRLSSSIVKCHFPSEVSPQLLPTSLLENFGGPTQDSTSLAGGTVLKLCNFRERSGWGHVPAAPHNISHELAVLIAGAVCGSLFWPMEAEELLVMKSFDSCSSLWLWFSHMRLQTSGAGISVNSFKFIPVPWAHPFTSARLPCMPRMTEGHHLHLITCRWLFFFFFKDSPTLVCYQCNNKDTLYISRTFPQRSFEYLKIVVL